MYLLPIHCQMMLYIYTKLRLLPKKGFRVTERTFIVTDRQANKYRGRHKYKSQPRNAFRGESFRSYLEFWTVI